MPCDRYDFGNGVTAIVCRRGQRTKRCSSPGCVSAAPLLCDYPLANGKTCDKPVCKAHSETDKTKPDTDYCAPHARLLRGATRKETP